MKIAIIGAGFAGLATAWHLLQHKDQIPLEITIFDSVGAGGGASGIAAGLLHPFSGLHAKLNRFGEEGYNQASLLLDIAQKALKSQVYTTSSLLRVALSKEQEDDYLKCSLTNPQVDFLNANECQKLIPSLSFYPGILIKDAKTAYAKPYLQGLFLACLELNAKFEQLHITDLNQLDNFTHIVVTAGAGIALFKELQHISFSFTKGQILELEWPNDLPPLPLALNSKAYLMMSQDQKSCIAGATFEKVYIDKNPDQKKAEAEILPQVEALIPSLKHAKVIGCKAAFRVSSKNHLPLIEKVNSRLFVFTGLGSKGLLYHGLYAKKLAELITQGL